jgi:SynChlorMet cassette radical SAM/SPASM protein ScmE
MTEPKVISSPKHVDIAITGKCNLACRYCYYADEMVARTNLPTQHWLSFFEELGALKVMTVCISGGEPFTHPDLFELIDGVIANRMRYTLNSNGTLITEETLAQFEFGKRRQRLDSIQISVDGSSAEVHDRSRPKSFGRAIRGLKLLKEAGFPVTVRVTVNRHNVDDLENVAHLLLEEVGLSSFSTNEAYACGATDRTEGDIILTPSQRKKG